MAKTATFAATHFTVAFAVGYTLTGDVAVSSALALVEPACNTVAYYFHEKAWLRFGHRPDAAGTASASHHGWHHV
ncbi:DUF2061 domain-containing protein [Azospira restricta]|uniref:DUF2061 domain-containing protein n=1 Tax=Azospira restricta TaxID=404405 RepID=A0A974PX17_9RHOO|nr:DUF2061 domain-containing protein [Azospira restricta]QRJ62970.1 DUF2061 domain-containing protein [Azospira restricta]